MREIELLRQKLNKLAETEEDLTSPSIVELSQELDKKLNKYMNDKMKKE